MVATSRVNSTRPPLAEMLIVLVDVGAVEQQRVGALAAFDGVAAVAGIPDEGIVAGTEKGDVVAAAAVDDVIAGAAGDGVVAVAAVDVEADSCPALIADALMMSLPPPPLTASTSPASA